MKPATWRTVMNQALTATLKSRASKAKGVKAIQLLKADELQALADLVARNRGEEDPEGYIARVMEMRLNEKNWPSDMPWLAGLIVPVALVALGWVLGLGLPGCGLCLAIGMLVVLFIAMGTSTTSRARRIWSRHEADGRSAAAALEEMGNVLEGSAYAAVPAALKITVIALTVIGLGLSAVELLTHQDYYMLQATLKGGLKDAGIYQTAILGEDGVVSGDELRAVTEFMQSSEDEPEKRVAVTLAAVACVPEGGFPEEQAREMAMQALTADISQDSCTEVQVLSLLNFVGRDAFNGEIFKQLNAAGFLKGDGVRHWIAQMPIAQHSAIYNELAGSASQAEMGELMLSYHDAAEMERRLMELDEERRKYYIQLRGGMLTDPDEVLAHIRFGQQMGFTPTQIYPEGAVISLSTAHCDYVNESDTMPEGPFLVLYRTEEKEKFESLNAAPAENYEYNRSRGDAPYTVVLDTYTLEKLPAEVIPQTMEECAGWFIVDLQYWNDGYLYQETKRGYGAYASYVETTFYPTYAAWHLVTLFDAKTGEWYLVFDQKTNNSPEVPSTTSSATARMYYSGSHDKDWAKEHGRAFVDALVQSGCNIWMTYFSYQAGNAE